MAIRHFHRPGPLYSGGTSQRAAPLSYLRQILSVVNAPSFGYKPRCCTAAHYHQLLLGRTHPHPLHRVGPFRYPLPLPGSSPSCVGAGPQRHGLLPTGAGAHQPGLLLCPSSPLATGGGGDRTSHRHPLGHPDCHLSGRGGCHCPAPAQRLWPWIAPGHCSGGQYRGDRDHVCCPLYVGHTDLHHQPDSLYLVGKRRASVRHPEHGSCCHASTHSVGRWSWQSLMGHAARCPPVGSAAGNRGLFFL